MTATHRRTAAAVGVLLSLCGSAVAIPPGVRVVNHAAAPGGNGQSWAAAYHDLQDALAEAKVNAAVGEIWVAKGTYRPAAGPSLQSQSFELMSALAVYGGFAGGEQTLEERDWATNITTLSGDLGDDVHVWHVVSAHQTDQSALLDGFTVTGGRATQASAYGARGGGILILDGEMTVANCRIVSNSAAIEGGSTPLSAARGGGVYGRGLFDNCTFQSNSTSGHGGGVSGSAGHFIDCRFIANYAFYEGGGVNGSAMFERCLFQGNNAGTQGYGGAAVSGNGDYIDCDFFGNYAPFDAGAVSGGGYFLRCRIIDNSADTGALGRGTFELVECSVENNLGMFTGFYDATIIATRTVFRGNDPFQECDVFATHCTFEYGVSGFDALIDRPDEARLTNCVFRGNDSRGIVRMSGSGKVEIANSTFINDNLEAAAVVLSGSSVEATIHNCIFWNSGGGTQNDHILIDVGTLDLQHSIIQGWTGSLGGSGNHGFDPVFADTEGRLAAGSPAIDAGDNTLLPVGITQDLDGNPRLVDDPGTPNTGLGSPPVDRGAYEFQDSTCYANCDQSTTAPKLNVDDFTCFINRYAAAHPLANCDGSTTPPVLNVDDFTCFINAFAAGCP